MRCNTTMSRNFQDLYRHRELIKIDSNGIVHIQIPDKSLNRNTLSMASDHSTTDATASKHTTADARAANHQLSVVHTP
jgi:hypothetical protein